MAKKLKIYNGSSWEDVTFAITPPNTAVTNAFTTNQVIETSTSVAALRITQNGSGEAFRVEDSTNPDSSPFIISADGLLGIGTTDFSVRGLTNSTARIVMSGGIVIANYAETLDSGITIARANGTPSSPTQILSGQRTAFFLGNTYGSSSFNNNVGMSFWASENQTDTARGSHITFDTTTIGTVGRAERMRIDSYGNVGIGLSAPASKLHVNGSFRQTGATVPYEWTVNPGGTDYLKLNAVGYTDNILVLSADGNVGFGVAPTFKIHTLNNFSSATVGAQALVFQAQIANGNQDYLKLYSERTLSGGASWSTQDWILRRHVDASPMGGFKWAASEWNPIAFYGAPNDRSVRTTYISTGTPSGGSDGDMWATYV